MRKNAPTLAIVAVDTEENERLRFGVNYSVIHSPPYLVLDAPARLRRRARARALREWQGFRPKMATKSSFSTKMTNLMNQVVKN